MSNGIRWTEDDYAAWLAKSATDDRATVQATDLESNSEHGFEAKDESKKVHPRFRIHVHSRRRRLADPDGISAKWAIDGLAKGGILLDDSADWVESVSFSQEVSKNEETIIELEEID